MTKWMRWSMAVALAIAAIAATARAQERPAPVMREEVEQGARCGR